MNKVKIYCMLLIACVGMTFTGCKEDDNIVNKDYDATLYGEWVAYDGTYVHDYYCFYSDGTGIHGSYESDIDWVNENDDIKWYTVNDEYLYIDGNKHKYFCNGSSLQIGNKRYHEK